MSATETDVTTPATPKPRSNFRDGWSWLAFVTAARVYLFFLLTLLGFAFIPLVFGLNSSVVMSGSMEPHIRPGDVVLTTPLPQGSPVPQGRVVRFNSAAAAEPDGVARQRLHRVVGINDDGTYITAGDANADVDSVPLTRAQITGEARILVPVVGLPGYWLKTTNFPALALWAVLTLAALALLVFDEPPPPSGNTKHNSHLSRRALLFFTGAAAISIAVLSSRPSSTAAFSTRTVNVANSWTVALSAPLTIGRATGYALLASTSISNAGFLGGGTYISGSIGTSPGRNISGFYFWNVSGGEDANTPSSRNGKNDAQVLYDAASSRPNTSMKPAALKGTITPGTYASSTGAFTLSGTLTLDARKDTSAVFILKANTLSAAANSTVKLVNGASASNIYWIISETINLGTSSTGAGNYLANGNIVLQNNTTVTGRIISLNGSINTTSTNVTLP